jgi:hypothetical protein
MFLFLFSAAWVHRGFSDDVTELSTVQPGADLITDFQKDKFRHFFFHVLDLNSDCVISSEDFEKLNEVKFLIKRKQTIMRQVSWQPETYL